MRLGFGSNGFWRSTEKLSKLASRVRQHALQGLGPTCGVVGKRFLGEFGQFVLGLRKEFRPALLGCEFLKDERCHGVLFGLRKFLDFTHGFLEKVRHKRFLERLCQILLAACNAV